MAHEHSGGGLDDLHAALDTTPAFEAAREGDAAALAHALDTDAAQLAARDKYGFTLLHWACDRGQESTAALLLARGADANAVEKRLFKRTPLLLASLSGNSTLVQLLLRHEANTATADYKGWCAVHCAAHAGSIDALRALVAAGACLDVLTKRNESALHLAARMGHTALVSELVGSSSKGEDAASDAALRNAPDTASQLLRVRSEMIGVRDADGAAAADVARASGHDAIAAILSGASSGSASRPSK